MAEAQLIGRGARYCPFRIEDDQPLYQRKFDVVGNEEEHELKICEELYYHSAHNPRYIDELHTAMEEIGIKPKRSYQISLNLKDTFLETDTYKEGKIFTNERIKYNREDITKLDDSARNYLYKVRLRTGYMVTTTIYSGETGLDLKTSRKDYKLSDFHPNVIRKALHRLPLFHFSSLKKYFPHLKSHTEFITSGDFLAQISVEVTGHGDRILNLSHADQLDITVQVLEKLSAKMKNEFVEFKGTKKFKPYSIKDTISNKTINKRLIDEFELDHIWKGEDYIIWGLPFFNEQKRRGEFEEAFQFILQ